MLTIFSVAFKPCFVHIIFQQGRIIVISNILLKNFFFYLGIPFTRLLLLVVIIPTPIKGFIAGSLESAN